MKKILFVDSDPRITQRAERLLRPLNNRFRVVFLNNGNQAKTWLSRESFDIVISDIHLKGISGADLLRHIQRHSPQTVRIILSGQARKETILRSVDFAHQFISKPFDYDSLTESIFNAVSLGGLIQDKKLRNLLLSIRSLPSFPSLYIEIVEELRGLNPSSDRVGEIISRDMSMSAKVLQLVNSAYFGLSRQINDPTQAAVILGLETIRDLVLSLQLFSQFDQNKIRRLGLSHLWDHSISVGLFSKIIIKTMTSKKDMINAAFLAGLLHDLGKLVLVENFTMRYYSAIGVSVRKNIALHEAEMEMFNATHSQLGAYLLSSWGISPMVAEAIAYHHNLGRTGKKKFSLAVALHVANVFDNEKKENRKKAVLPQLDVTYLKEIGVHEKVEVWRELCLGTTN